MPHRFNAVHIHLLVQAILDPVRVREIRLGTQVTPGWRERKPSTLLGTTLAIIRRVVTTRVQTTQLVRTSAARWPFEEIIVKMFCFIYTPPLFLSGDLLTSVKANCFSISTDSSHNIKNKWMIIPRASAHLRVVAPPLDVAGERVEARAVDGDLGWSSRWRIQSKSEKWIIPKYCFSRRNHWYSAHYQQKYSRKNQIQLFEV